MAAPNPEISANNAEQDAIVAAADELVASLPRAKGTTAALQEGRDIADIVESLGLPGDVLAAVRLWPLVRDELIDEKTLEQNELKDISRLIQELIQLSKFKLADDWSPGEALAVSQSEALRKMLLAVVSDVRLVLARIAEQLFRLRQAKQAPPKLQKALAIETREIYAALASRLGVWQLKWELEDLAFRYLEPDTYARIAKALNEKRIERERFIEAVKSLLQSELENEGIASEITGRPKHIYSI